MKKVFSLVLTISLIVSVFAAVPVFAENEYVVNGDFENGLTDWKASNPNAHIKVEEETSGNKYLCLKSDTGGIYVTPSGSSKLWTNSGSLQPGDRLTLKFDLRIISLNSDAYARVAIGYKNSAGTVIESKPYYNYYGHIGEWATYSLDLLMPETAYGLTFYLRLYGGGGEIHFDNVSLTDGENKTKLTVAHGDQELDRIPDGLNHLKAKIHYVPEATDGTSGNLIFAAYSADKLAALEIVPFSVASSKHSVYKEAILNLPENAKDISVKAYLWKNGQTLEPIAATKLLPEEGRSEVFDRFITERMRGAYGANKMFYRDEDGDGKYEVMDRLLDAGINTFIFQIHTDAAGTGADKNFTALENAIKDLSDFAQENNVMMFPKFNFGTNAVVSMKDYGYYHKGDDTTRTNVCPLAEQYWKDAMQARMEIAAKYPNITGVVFDMEMYSGESTRYSTPCLCESCVNKYAQANPSDLASQLVAADITTRLEFIKNNNLYASYWAWMGNEITKITASIREHLHAINPDLILGIMPGYGWIPGIEKGLGTEEMPVLIFGEGSYDGNFDGGIYKTLSSMEKNDVNAVLTAGLFPIEDGEHITTAEFADKVSEAGMATMGYWIYAIQYLENDYTLADGQSYGDYYPELKKGNEMLDAALGRK